MIKTLTSQKVTACRFYYFSISNYYFMTCNKTVIAIIVIIKAAYMIRVNPKLMSVAEFTSFYFFSINRYSSNAYLKQNDQLNSYKQIWTETMSALPDENRCSVDFFDRSN